VALCHSARFVFQTEGGKPFQKPPIKKNSFFHKQLIFSMHFTTCIRLGGMMALLFAISACGSKAIDTPAPVTEQSTVMFYNGTANGNSFTLNGTAVGTAVDASKGTAYLPITYTPTATNTVALKASTGEILKSAPVTFKKGVSMSFFTWRELLSAGTPQTYGTRLVEDNLTAPSTGKAKIRVALMTRDGGTAYNIRSVVQATQVEKNIFTNVKLGDVTDFIEIDPGTYGFGFDRAGGATTDGGMSNIQLAAGKIYTISTAGFFLSGSFVSSVVTNN
jgi:Domain of unknown function (DUF4397)